MEGGGISAKKQLANTLDMHNLTFAVSPLAANKGRRFQLSEVSLHEEQGLARQLEKSVDHRKITKEEEIIIKQKAEFYRLDFFNAVMG